MSKRHLFGLCVAFAPVAACGGAPETGAAPATPSSVVLGSGIATPADEPDVVPAEKLTRAADGSLRRSFLGGAFVTWNKSMPIEVDQAIAGERPRRPVVVWAGLE